MLGWISKSPLHFVILIQSILSGIVPFPGAWFKLPRSQESFAVGSKDQRYSHRSVMMLFRKGFLLLINSCAYTCNSTLSLKREKVNIIGMNHALTTIYI